MIPFEVRIAAELSLRRGVKPVAVVSPLAVALAHRPVDFPRHLLDLAIALETP